MKYPNKVVFELNINRIEVLRYLGCHGKNGDEASNRLIDECIEEIKALMNINAIFNVFDIEKHNKRIFIKSTTLYFEGRDIYRHHEKCEKSALMAATLGNAIDKRIRYYSKTDLTKAVVLDACATAAIEALCDKTEETIRNIAKKDGFNITHRFSPGYGDLSTNIQAKFIRILDANRKIGLTVTENNILLPRKSITAIIGFSKERITNKKRECIECKKYKDCSYAKEGEQCESKKTS